MGVPLTFLACVGIGGQLGFAGVPIPHVDRVIALSLVTFGLAVAMPARPHRRICDFSCPCPSN